jgi:hypothetical protein
MAIDLKNIFHFFSAYPRATFGGSAVANVELLFLVYDSHSSTTKYARTPSCSEITDFYSFLKESSTIQDALKLTYRYL